jgi:FlaA1/EpsC-like NDP-sugar epimerase
VSVVEDAVATDTRPRLAAAREPGTWTKSYFRWIALADCLCSLLAGGLAMEVRFVSQHYLPASYLAFTLALPAIWSASIALEGGYEPRFFGAGSDEFRRVLNAALSLAACVAIVSYVFKADVARGYVAIALPCTAGFSLVGRYALRKRLHFQRARGLCMQRVVAVGHAPAVADLVATLSRDKYNGLSVVGACLAGRTMLHEIAGVPVFGGLGSVSVAVDALGADTVAVLACPEMNGMRLRELACASRQLCSMSQGPVPRSAQSPDCHCCR